eukprot:7201363-Prorocentrum_lima.AAC.1
MTKKQLWVWGMLPWCCRLPGTGPGLVGFAQGSGSKARASNWVGLAAAWLFMPFAPPCKTPRPWI